MGLVAGRPVSSQSRKQAEVEHNGGNTGDGVVTLAKMPEGSSLRVGCHL